MFSKIEITKPDEKLKIDFSKIEKYRILASDEIPKPDIVLQFQDKIIATRKNVFGVTGKAKVGKTFLMTLLNQSVLLKGEFQNTIKSYLPAGKDKIVYIDTEQSSYHVNLVMKRIFDVVGSKKIDNLLMYNFDAVGTDNRLEYTKHLIYNTKGVGLVIIDGIADLVKTINDEIIASEMADNLRIWATECDISIGYVLHQNPGDTGKMRGHLGTILMNKSETVIQISSAIDNDAIKVVEAVQTRNAKPDNWSFEIIDGIPVIQDECYTETKPGRPKAKLLNDIERYGLLNTVFSTVKNEDGIHSNILIERIRCAYTDTHGDISSRKVEDFVKYAKEMNWLVTDGHKQPYFLYPFKTN